MELGIAGVSTNSLGQGDCHKSSDPAWAASSDSTSARSSSSEPQASRRNTSRSPGSRSRAAPKSSLTFSHCLVFSTGTSLHFARQPRSSHGPIALDGRRGNSHYLRRFFHRQPAEKPQLHDPHLLLI